MQNVLVKVRKGGQMAIPRLIRDKAGVGEGSVLQLSVVKGRGLLLKPHVADHGKSALEELANAVAGLRADAKRKGLDRLSKREIHAAVARARRDRSKAGR